MKLLWIGDGVHSSGFARVAHSILPQLQAQGWEVVMLAINYHGDPHPLPWRIYPAISGGDIFGIQRFAEICAREKPDVVLINQDAWIVVRFLTMRADHGIATPIVAYMPIDGAGLRTSTARDLNRLDHAVFYTEFGAHVANVSGFEGLPTSIVPHGINREHFRAHPRELARERCGLSKVFPKGSFVFGNVNRNQPRKRLDLTIEMFARWLHENPQYRESTYLYLHCADDRQGWDLRHLSRLYGIKDRVHLPDLDEWKLADDSVMPFMYSSLDCQVSTSLGEGWGLTTMEGMGCGVPQILPYYAALAEWAKDSALFVPIDHHQGFTGHETTIVGGVVNTLDFRNALTTMRENDALRESFGALGYQRVQQERFDWKNIAGHFDRILTSTVKKRESVAA